jgi:dTDP-4-amino-4,6-dideoxygalactose transaminase
MERFRSHGITRDASRMRNAGGPYPAAHEGAPGPPAWYYEQHGLGYNYRLTDIHAVLGSSQLRRIDAYVERRNALARRYDETLAALPLQLPSTLPGNRSAIHLYVVRLRRDICRKTHRQVFDELRQKGIGVNLHYFPVHLQPYYRDLGFGPGQFPEAEAYGESAITLPLYPAMDDRDQDRVIETVTAVLAQH